MLGEFWVSGPDKALSLNATLRALTSGEGAPDGQSSERLSLAEVVRQLDDQARGILIILFALPNLIPSVPGTSAVTGLPLVFLCVQMALQRPPWLPRFLSDRSISRLWLEAILDKAQPWILRVERLIRPRLSILTTGPAEQFLGLLGVILSLTVMLPIPLGNALPALALICLSLGLIGRDGVWVLTGLFMSGMAAALLAVAGWAAFQSMLYMSLNWFGMG